jgi:hypothetical protein
MANVKFKLEVVLEYDDMEVTGHDAQEYFLDEIPNEFAIEFPKNYGRPRYRVHLHSAKVVEGLLDKDDCPVE